MASQAQSYAHYLEHGWCQFDADKAMLQWVHASQTEIYSAISKPGNRHWFRYQNTWFVGVNVLNNDGSGRVPNGISLQGQAVDFLRQRLGANLNALDRGQVSVMFPGYPQPDDRELEAAYRYRKARDAAHVDGLLKDGDTGQRFAREYHEYILAISVHTPAQSAAPFVVWRGSHTLIQKEFQTFFAGAEEAQIKQMDISACYSNVRKKVFEECERVELPLQTGQAIVAHRLLLHGTAPWTATEMGKRTLCFFRPVNISAHDWLNAE